MSVQLYSQNSAGLSGFQVSVSGRLDTSKLEDGEIVCEANAC